MPAHDFQELEINDCINCHISSQGHYCSHCGQSMTISRISFKSLAIEFQERIIGIDGRFLRTLLHSISRPGTMALAFIAGNRKRYISPVGYFLIFLTIYVLLLGFSNMNFGVLSNKIIIDSEVNTSSNADALDLFVVERVKILFDEYFRVIIFFTVLLNGFFIWVFNRKERFNFIETMVFALYIEAVFLIFNILSLPFAQMDSTWLQGVIWLVSLIYFSFAYLNFYKASLKIKSVLKALAIRLSVTITIGVLFILYLLIVVSLSDQNLVSL